MDCTAQFNAMRQFRGLAPLSPGWRVEQNFEGRKLPCGCEVINVSGTAYTERHRREVCTANWMRWEVGQYEKKYRVGRDGYIAADTDDVNKVIYSCNPFAGLFPHEEVS